MVASFIVHNLEAYIKCTLVSKNRNKMAAAALLTGVILQRFVFRLSLAINFSAAMRRKKKCRFSVGLIGPTRNHTP